MASPNGTQQPLYVLATYDTPQGPRAGMVVGEALHDAAEATGRADYATVLGILEDWDRADEALRAAAAKADPNHDMRLAHASLRAPVLYPPTIYCAGANYSDHVAEMSKGQPPEPDPHTLGLKPWHFIKGSRCVADPDGTVQIPEGCQKLDYEIELVAVIGRKTRNISIADALSCVAGYTAGNDLSARDLSRRPHTADTSPFKYDWVAHKSFEGSGPIGPWIVPARDIPDPGNLGLKLWINDEIKQDSNSNFMIYNLAEQISHLSSRMTLHPGDLIMTGTPAGVGAGRGEFLKSGDVVKIWIERIGELHTRIA
ncbi:MAG TPA: fumarylacetoacetate hydrolase family protein [Xanthobacteraceae bacterium]|nr:fumarylacetoacetate hydrolase family protein [Xanthobacteraceae bacterium]